MIFGHLKSATRLPRFIMGQKIDKDIGQILKNHPSGVCGQGTLPLCSQNFYQRLEHECFHFYSDTCV